MAHTNQNENDFTKIKEEEELEWWRPTKQDNFNLTKKLIRTGCRPLKRKYIRCLRSEDDNQFENCTDLKTELDKCIKLTKFVYATKSD